MASLTVGAQSHFATETKMSPSIMKDSPTSHFPTKPDEAYSPERLEKPCGRG